MRLDPLLLVTAALYVGAGLALTFAPAEILAALGQAVGAPATWAAQLAGAGLLAVGWQNWLQRHAVVRGIYGRPTLLANLMFGLTAGGACLSAWRAGVGAGALAAAVALLAAAGAFGLRMRQAPAPPTPT